MSKEDVFIRNPPADLSTYNILRLDRIEISQEHLEAFFRHIGQFTGDRFDRDWKKHRLSGPGIPFSEPHESMLHPQYRLFNGEIDWATHIVSESNEYIPADQMHLIYAALELSFIAHRDHYRDSHENVEFPDSKYPYSKHLTDVALSLIRTHKQDAVTIAASLLHDSLEDTWMTPDIIREKISHDSILAQEVAETVRGLSDVRRPGVAREVSADEYTKQIVESFLSNPRVAIIKVIDRLWNMRSCETFDENRRRRYLRETEDIIIPVAKRLGMYEEAEELEQLVIAKIDNEHEQWVKDAQGFIERGLPQEYLTQLKSELEITLGVPFVQVRRPKPYDLFLKMEELRAPSRDDIHLNIDVPIPTGYATINNPSQWGQAVLHMVDRIAFSKEKGLVLNPSTEQESRQQFAEEVYERLSFSVTAHALHFSDSLQLHLHVMPQFYFDLEQRSLTKLYRHRPTLQTDFTVGAGSDWLAKEHVGAWNKWEFLQGWLNRLREKYEREGIVYSQLIRFFEPRIRAGFMEIIGIDDNGKLASWRVRKHSTVLDYAADALSDWRTTDRVIVNGFTVSYHHELNPRDRIHIVRKGKERWDPEFISSFNTYPAAAIQVRTNVERIIDLEGKRGKERMLRRVLKTGKRRIERELDPPGTPLRIGLRRVRKLIEQSLSYRISDQDFFREVGLGNVDSSLIRQVAKALEGPNRRVAGYEVWFKKDAPGQADAVLSVLSKFNIPISIRDIGTEIYGDVDDGHIQTTGPSAVVFYLDPDDDIKYRELILDTIRADRRCRKKGLTDAEVRLGNS